jgi:hypothetical protein
MCALIAGAPALYAAQAASVCRINIIRKIHVYSSIYRCMGSHAAKYTERYPLLDPTENSQGKYQTDELLNPPTRQTDDNYKVGDLTARNLCLCIEKMVLQRNKITVGGCSALQDAQPRVGY